MSVTKSRAPMSPRTAPEATRTPMPAWLREHLHATGKLGRDAITRRAKTGFCDTCWSIVIRGLDAPIAALPVTVDPQPLSPLGEVLALAAGRRSYDLTWRGDRYELDHRDHWGIRTRPAGAINHVVADHQCGHLLPEIARTEKCPTPPRGINRIPDEPPF